jgi:hypothetical protein
MSSVPARLVRRVVLATWQWVAAVLVGMWWAARHLRGTWWFYDEWTVIWWVTFHRESTSMFENFNGHLWLGQYWLFRAIGALFGFDSHRPLIAVMLGGLLVLHLSLAWMLRAAGLRDGPAVVMAGLLTYLGTASQNWIFAVQIAPAVSLACGSAATALVLGRPPRPRRAVAIGVLMVASVAFDSGTALVGLAFCVTAIVLCWPRRWWSVALPSLVGAGAWFAFGGHGEQFPASFGHRLSFAWHLLLGSAGGTVGRGEAVGAVLLVAAAVTLVVAVRGGLPRAGLALAIGGGVGSALTLAGITVSRAGISNFQLEGFNRYIANVALPLVVGVAPAATVVARRCWRNAPAYLPRVVVTVAAVVFFWAGLGPLRTYHDGFVAMNAGAYRAVTAAMVVVRDGCPDGGEPDPNTRPVGDLSPQVLTYLLRELMEEGQLSVPAFAEADPEITARMCPD